MLYPHKLKQANSLLVPKNSNIGIKFFPINIDFYIFLFYASFCSLFYESIHTTFALSYKIYNHRQGKRRNKVGKIRGVSSIFSSSADFIIRGVEQKYFHHGHKGAKKCLPIPLKNFAPCA